MTSMLGWTPSLLGFGFFLVACTPHRLLAATSSFDHGHQIPTTEGARERSPLVRRDHRSHKSREGDLKHHTGSGCVQFCQGPSHYDRGGFLRFTPVYC